MPTYDDRLATLEHKVAALELRRLYNESQAREDIPPEQGRNLREINENMAILLGGIGEQWQDIRTLQTDVCVVKEYVERVDRRLDSAERKLENFDQRFVALEEKFDQVLQLLTALKA
ncbi:MAG TPA: hypothetical protein VL485_09570 [Ktedonobacteraceae bacterium]|jgi:septal ring factor EnvC (AmiA/AmiB activator)|nr:hypothetical protein [Ktedonobacteraceae bacterium]